MIIQKTLLILAAAVLLACAGDSTITQQLAKNLYLRFTRIYPRRAVELLIALALERRLGKARILALYVNIIYACTTSVWSSLPRITHR